LRHFYKINEFGLYDILKVNYKFRFDWIKGD